MSGPGRFKVGAAGQNMLLEVCDLMTFNADALAEIAIIYLDWMLILYYHTHLFLRFSIYCLPCLQETNKLLKESLAIEAEDATTALSNMRQKQLAVLSRVDKKLAEVHRQLDGLRLGKRDRSWVNMLKTNAKI